jgi:hypothetical protein
MITSASNLAEANPDVLDYSQVTGCDMEIDERQNEIKRKDREGKMVSYIPPRYEYSYDFYCTVRVNHPYFDDMRFQINNGTVRTGENQMGAVGQSGWTVAKNTVTRAYASNEYNEYVKLGNEMKRTVDGMRQEIRAEVRAMNAPKTAVTCPWCGATTIPDASGCCEYCGGSVNA